MASIPGPLTSLGKANISVLLLEGIHRSAAELFLADGYTQVTQHEKALAPEQLREALAGVHMLGIRSRTQLTAEILACLYTR